MIVEITDDAKKETEDSVRWYESKKRGLGSEFKAEVKCHKINRTELLAASKSV